jgi:Glutamate-cysteine ligase family 2(GCS2)
VPLTQPEPDTHHDRYDALMEKYALTAREQLTCGCHVHVSVRSDEEGVAVLDRIRSWLPSLIALSSNSPFWNGTDSGYASFRTGNGPKWFPRAVATPTGNPGEGRTCVAWIGFPSSLPPVSRALGYLDGDARVGDHYWGSIKMPVDGASCG